jgi:hypothetical protein
MSVRRLMLDEMYSPQIAEEFAKRGHDVIAVAADLRRVSAPDEELLRIATADDRTLVTENVRDFEILRTQWLKEGRACAGLLYTNRQRFPRDRKWTGRLVAALDARLSGGFIPGAGQVDWLT